MPLEIRELVIKVTIEEHPRKPTKDIAEKLESFKEELIRQCYERIINKLESHLER